MARVSQRVRPHAPAPRGRAAARRRPGRRRSARPARAPGRRDARGGGRRVCRCRRHVPPHGDRAGHYAAARAVRCDDRVRSGRKRRLRRARGAG
ncbi:hypothetical protein CVS37_36845 [Burkholderia lata]|nr:hypothetical protein CVS37_36845 [Burkholderia lata]